MKKKRSLTIGQLIIEMRLKELGIIDGDVIEFFEKITYLVKNEKKYREKLPSDYYDWKEKDDSNVENYLNTVISLLEINEVQDLYEDKDAFMYLLNSAKTMRQKIDELKKAVRNGDLDRARESKEKTSSAIILKFGTMNKADSIRYDLMETLEGDKVCFLQEVEPIIERIINVFGIELEEKNYTLEKRKPEIEQSPNEGISNRIEPTYGEVMPQSGVSKTPVIPAATSTEIMIPERETSKDRFIKWISQLPVIRRILQLFGNKENQDVYADVTYQEVKGAAEQKLIDMQPSGDEKKESISRSSLYREEMKIPESQQPTTIIVNDISTREVIAEAGEEKDTSWQQRPNRNSKKGRPPRGSGWNIVQEEQE
ncbi:MAG: hypothetical protein IJK18_04700 [Clostridia bacterium]|nr:hypothetical protein [Clostridia bacterium]